MNIYINFLTSYARWIPLNGCSDAGVILAGVLELNNLTEDAFGCVVVFKVICLPLPVNERAALLPPEVGVKRAAIKIKFKKK